MLQEAVFFNKQDLADLISRELDLDLDPMEIELLGRGRSAQTVVAGDVVIKILKPQYKYGKSFNTSLVFFEREPQILEVLKKNITAKVPLVHGVGKTMAIYAMEKINGVPFVPFSPVSNFFVNSVSQFMKQFDRALSKHSIIPQNKDNSIQNHNRLFETRISQIDKKFAIPLHYLWKKVRTSVCEPQTVSSRFLHMDLAPDNVFMRRNAQISVIDYGSASFNDPHVEVGKLIGLYGQRFGQKLVESLNKQTPSWNVSYDQALAHTCLYLLRKSTEPISPILKVGIWGRSWQLALETSPSSERKKINLFSKLLKSNQL